MKVTAVEIVPDGAQNAITLDFKDYRGKQSFNVRAIQGLDAEDIVPRYYPGANLQQFYNQTLSSRNIVFKIGLNPDFSTNTYSDLRDILYRAIASSRTGLVGVYFWDESEIVATISGFVRKFETAHFEKLQEVQLTLECPNPILKSPDAYFVPALNMDMAEFVISDVRSTAPHGVTFWWIITSPVGALAIASQDGSEFRTIPQGVAAFQADDVVGMTSDPDNRSIFLIRGTQTIYLADAIVPGSIWPMIFPGDNIFSMENPTHFAFVNCSYYFHYWGV